MKTVHKFMLPTSVGYIGMPAGAEVLSVGLDPRGMLSLWALVDTGTLEHTTHEFALVGTGEQVPEGAQFVGSVKDGSFMWHVFEVKR